MDRASQTAKLAAVARASQARELDTFRGPDDLAVRFLSPTWQFVVNTEPLRRLVRRLTTRRMPGTYGFIIARSKCFDDFVRQELAGGAKQLVILGAGYDSRAYRFRDAIEACGGRAFEVDAPATLAKKRESVVRVFGALPRHVSYVEVDFNRDALEKKLTAAGFDPSARTVYTWEGVTFYISAAAVDAVLAFIREHSGAGSGVVLDYLFPSALDDSSTAFGAVKSAARVRQRGEPFTFSIDPDRIEDFLRERGFGLEGHFRPEQMESEYLGGSVRDEAFRVGGFYGIAMARTSNRSG